MLACQASDAVLLLLSRSSANELSPHLVLSKIHTDLHHGCIDIVENGLDHLVLPRPHGTAGLPGVSKMPAATYGI